MKRRRLQAFVGPVRRGQSGMIADRDFWQVAMTFTNALGGLCVVLLCALTPPSALIAQRGAGAAGTPIALDATTTILLGADEPPALIEAARDLASDFEKVLGQKPRIVQRREEAGRATVLIGYRSALVQGL